MSNFKRAFTETFKFDGDTVTVTMKSLSRQNMMILAPHIVSPEEAENVGLKDSMEMFEAAAQVLPDSVTMISGLFIEGVEVTRNNDLFDVVLAETYFMELVGNIVGALMTGSSVKRGDEKNSVRQPNDTTADTGE